MSLSKRTKIWTKVQQWNVKSLLKAQKWKEKQVRWNTLSKTTPGHTHKAEIQNRDWINEISKMKGIHSTLFKIITEQLF